MQGRYAQAVARDTHEMIRILSPSFAPRYDTLGPDMKLRVLTSALDAGGFADGITHVAYVSSRSMHAGSDKCDTYVLMLWSPAGRLTLTLPHRSRSDFLATETMPTVWDDCVIDVVHETEYPV